MSIYGKVGVECACSLCVLNFHFLVIFFQCCIAPHESDNNTWPSSVNSEEGESLPAECHGIAALPRLEASLGQCISYFSH